MMQVPMISLLLMLSLQVSKGKSMPTEHTFIVFQRSKYYIYIYFMIAPWEQFSILFYHTLENKLI